jgi:hypothetical protein
MLRVFTNILRSALAASILLLSPGLAGYAAAGQVISSQVTGSAAVGVQGNLPIMPGSSFSHAGVSLMSASLLAAPMATPIPTLGKTLMSPVVQSAVPAAQTVSVAAPVVSAETRISLPQVLAPAQAAEQAKAEVAPAAMGVLIQGTPADAAKPEAVEVSAARMGGLMDGSNVKTRPADDSVPVLAGDVMTSHAAPLAKPQTAVPAEAKPALPSPAAKASKSAIAVKIVLAVAVAALVLLMPAAALAAGAPLAGTAYAASVLGYMHPAASMVAAAVGAVYGAIAAKGKDGAAPSSGEVLGSVLRYGMLAGAGVYACMDIASVVFLGVRGAVSSLPAALATAALGQSAFQGKFKDADTSSADRIMSVFPAAATALGLNLGATLLKGMPALAMLSSLGVGAMVLTGVASLLFAVTYDPAKSPADGPARMARGFVLQALMTGLALAIGNQYLVALFAALAVWGFADVIYATARTVGKFLQELYHKFFPPAPKKS